MSPENETDLAFNPKPLISELRSQSGDRTGISELDWGSHISEVRPMTYVRLREGETQEGLVARFRSSIQQSGILRDLKDRRHFRSKAQKERLAVQRAARRRRRQNRRST